MKKILLFSLWIGLCAALGYYSLTLPLVKDIISIKSVNVVGTDKLTEEDIKNTFKNENWFFVSEDKIAKKLNKFPFIDEVKILKPQLGQINLIVKERKPFAIISINGKNFIVDENGKLFSDKVINNENLLKIFVNDDTFENDDIKKVRKILANFNSINFDNFIIQRSLIIGQFDGGKIIVFSRKDLDESINKAKFFLSKNGIKVYSYLNFSFSEMIIVKK